ncbi:MAG: hypothetical protein K0Q49_1039 [Haloplasmataceae bacterium]|jgi:ABC-type glycerol-3-phosphate transport system substrate-binding protein|nr:hypothetical protein [Haloplasmataceae bacterium]
MKDMLIKKAIKYTFWSFMSITLILFILSWFVVIENKEMRGSDLTPSFTCINTTKHNHVVKEIKITDVIESSQLKNVNDSCGYNQDVYAWTKEKANEITFNVIVEESNDYNIGIDYLSLNETIIDNAISIYINDELETKSAENMRLMTSFTNESNTKSFDTYHNQILNRQKLLKRWDYTVLREHLLLNNEAVNFSFLKGDNKITIVKEEGEFLLGNIYLVNKSEIKSYDEYLYSHEGPNVENSLITIEAENSVYKNDVAIRAENEKSPSVSPYDSNKNYINIIGNFFSVPGQKVTYAFDVDQAGFYNITLKYKNNLNQNTNSYRNIYVNDEIVFADLESYEFKYLSDWQNETLGNGTDFRFYFEEGINTIAFEVDATYVYNSYNKIMEMIDEISELSLDIKKLTGGTKDTQREWDLDKYLPSAKVKLNEWSEEIDTVLSEIKVLKSKDQQSNQIEKKLENVKMKLTELKNDHNKLPGKMNLLSEGSSSASQALSLISVQLLKLPLSLDKIYIHSEEVKIPKANSNTFVNIIAGMQRIISVTKPVEESEETLDIWVNRSRFYVELMQQMADSEFTPKTGIKVKFSVMPDEQKLILANAADTQPDVALGVSGWLPYELGLRGAAADLRQFESFNEVLNNFAPGSVLHMIHDDKVYGLPETQDFYVTFYRKDIFDELGLTVPQTYDEIIEILPTLQRYGMNYFLPLSGSGGLKPLTATAPFIYQYGGDLYDANEFDEFQFKTAIDSSESLRAINEMIELYTLYSLPLQTSNFYDSFRSGTLPIGVANFDTYTKLMFAAPEIANKWDIDLAPGYKNNDGTINRDNMGTAQSVVVFEKSDKKAEGFEFIEWWLSTEVQQQFTYDLQLIYGEGFLWNSANIEAFKSLPMNESHIEVISKQWEYIHEVPKIPGGYIIEREISNIWNKVVFDSESTRVTVDDAVILINREIERKMQEFGYLDKNGNKIKNYILPTKEKVKLWQQQARN